MDTLRSVSKRAQLFLMEAQFFRAIAALEDNLCNLRKPFGMQVECNFPADQQCDRQYEQAPRIFLSHKKQRSEHHGIVPVVDPALAAAFVFHKPRLEGAEKQNADDITDRIRAAQKDHNPVIQYARHMQGRKTPLNTIQISATSTVALLSWITISVVPDLI